MTVRRTAVAMAVAAATAALVTSCSAAHPRSTADEPRTGPVAESSSSVNRSNWPEATPTSGLAKGLSLPLEAYMETYQDTVALDDAERHLETQCLADYGLHVTFPPAGQTPPPSADDSNMPRRYGITDRAQAEKYGYGLPDAIQHQEGTRMPQLTKDQVEVLTGRTSIRRSPADPAPGQAPSTFQGKAIHKDGCAGWADDRLGTRDMDFSLVSQLDGESLTRSQRTPAVQNAIAAWSTCMKGKGYTVDTPYHAGDIVTHTDGSPSKEEIAVAVADIDCKQSTDLVKIWFAADSKIQEQQIKDHRSALDALRTRLGAARVTVTDVQKRDAQ
ncbi:hypothetical protein [Streptomyces griseorubiginosus]|uniref:hypothetical protein n=1 Tax=Streptomyces griseorubiginosus TaxID=67304 RepID=UPI002E821CBF|nr:hypothetical protein [Streptomyces griseorubiginosus]WUB45092.1 hypothetical protein OHN19_17770 [Streptomyces griseorubiginosus]WUB53609.1 hypothetical protein OG942_17765 [Streptomyces griseorubiginosus]